MALIEGVESHRFEIRKQSYKYATHGSDLVEGGSSTSLKQTCIPGIQPFRVVITRDKRQEGSHLIKAERVAFGCTPTIGR